MKKYREIIRDIRTDRDMSQADVATVLGTTQQHYSKYENGENEMPIRVLIALADYYDVSVDYLLGRPTGKAGYDFQNIKINTVTTAGKLVSEILDLEPSNRDDVVEFVLMQKLKEEYYRQNEKDGGQ